MNQYEEIGARIGALVDRKNAAYGDSINIAGEFLLLVYPNGIRPDQYNDAAVLIRIFDKCKRVGSKKSAFGENPFEDIAGYGILMARTDRQKGDTT